MDANISSKKLEGEISSAGVIEGGVLTRYAVDGADGVTPLLQIFEDNYWYVSYDLGVNWTSLGIKATGEAGKDGRDGADGSDGHTPYIENRNWYINGVNTDVRAEGVDAPVPAIKDGVWWIGNTNTNIKAIGIDGKNGINGKDGATPRIENGIWWIGTYNTGVRARGENVNCYSFDTLADMYAFVADPDKRKVLEIGDNLFVIDTDVPDYWWDGERVQPLETQKVFLQDYARTTDVKLTGKASTTIGGISRGKDYLNTPITTILSDLLFPYIPPTDVSLKLYDGNGDEILGVYEYGRVVTATKAKVCFTQGSKDITSLKIETTQGLRYSAESATGDDDDDPVQLDTTIRFDGTNAKDITLTLSDGESTIPLTETVSYAYHNYVAVTTDTTIPTSATALGVENIDTLSSATIETQDNTYIWFLMPNREKTTIKQYALTSWNDMNTTYAGEVDFTTSTGNKVKYYAYRTDKMMSDSADYCIS